MTDSRTLAFRFALAASLAAATAFASGPGTFKFDQSTLAVSEGTGTATVWVERSQGESGAVSVVVSSAGGTATPGSDFAPVAQLLSWADNDGAAKSVQVAILDDAAAEGSETIQLSLSGATGGAAIDPTRSSFTISVSDNDGGTPPPPPPPGCEPGDDSCNSGGSAGTFKFGERSFFAYESGAVAVVSVERSHGESGAASVTYSTADGSASAGADYTATTGTLSWAAGDGSTKTFTVPVLEDNLAEGPETIQLALTSPTGGAAIDSLRGSAVLTIVDSGDDTTPPGCEPGDDSCNGGGSGAAGLLEFDEASFQVLESQGLATIRVERSNGESGAVSVAYRATAGSATAGADFQAVTGTLSWAAGDETAKTFTVPILADTASEGTETVRLELSDPTGGSTIDLVHGTATLSIIDDDGPTTPCEPGDDHLCLLGGRFRAAINFRTPNFGSGVGVGRSVSLSDKSGYFWFFDAGNAEMLIKVIDGCGITSGPSYWVFYAATTNVDFTLTVTDTATGISKQFFNPLGKTAEPIQDVATFKTCQ